MHTHTHTHTELWAAGVARSAESDLSVPAKTFSFVRSPSQQPVFVPSPDADHNNNIIIIIHNKQTTTVWELRH